MLRLRVTLETSYLAKGIEYAPRLKVEGTWPGARFMRSLPKVCVVGEAQDVDMPLPTGDMTRSYVWLNLLSTIGFSGMADLDSKAQNKGQQLDLEAGAGAVDLATLVKSPSGVRVPVTDALLLHEAHVRLAEVDDTVLEGLSTKAMLHVQLVNAIPRSPPSSKGLRFNTNEYLETAMRNLNLLETHYLRFATTIDVQGIDMPKRRFDWPRDDSLTEHLHMARFESRVGPLPAIGYLCQDLSLRGPRLAAEVHEIRSKNAPAIMGALHNALLSSLLARGMRPQAFIDVVNKQHACKTDKLQSSYLTALAAVVHMATLAVTTVAYKVDGAIPNLDALHALPKAMQDKLLPPAPGTSGQFREKMVKVFASVREAFAAVPKIQRYGSLDADKAQLQAGGAALLVSLDAWTMGICSGLTKNDDCEGVGTGGVVMIETMHHVLSTADDKHITTELKALRDILGKFEAVLVGGSVSEPYVDSTASGSKGTIKHTDLPINGSPAAAKWSIAGHGWGLLMARARMASMQLRGIDQLDALHPTDRASVRAKLEHVVKQAKPWEHVIEPGVIEGTGQVNPWIGNVEEVYGKTDRADVFKRKAMASMKLARTFKANADTDPVAPFVKIESQPHEVWARTNPDQWRTPFYRRPVHINSIRSLAVSPLLGPCMLVHLPTMTRSATMSQLQTQPEDVALFPHYGDAISHAQWNKEIQPWLECALEHMPSSAFLADPAFLPKPESIGMVVPSAAVASLASTSLQGAALQSMSTRDVPVASLACIKIIEQTDESEDTTMLATTIPMTAFLALGETQTRAMMARLDDMVQKRELRSYAMVRDQPLAQCPATVQLLMAVPVDTDIDRVAFPPLKIAA